MKILKVKLNFSTAFHPQTDGQSERAFRTLEEMLRCFISFTQKDWDQYLPGLEFAYNNHINDATKQTPFFLEYGQHPFSISDILHADHTEEKLSKNPSTDSFIKEIEKANELAKLSIQEANMRNAENVNKRRREVEFKVGDKGMLSTKNLPINTGLSKKFTPKFVGPFTVVEILADGNACRIDLPHQYRNLHPTFHISLLKPFESDGRKSQDPTRFYPDIAPDSTKMERILAHRIYQGNTQFLVHFKDSESIEDTWINKTDLEENRQLIQKYMDKLFEDE